MNVIKKGEVLKEEGDTVTSGICVTTNETEKKRPKVSEMFEAVSTRFDNNDNEDNEKLPPPPPPSVQSKITKEQRNASLDLRIAALDAKTAGKKGKKKKIADKVKQMLIKNRAEGDKKLRSEDRFYLEVTFLSPIEDEDVTGYYFFSRLWSCGRVCDFIESRVGGKVESDINEFLVKVREFALNTFALISTGFF